MRTRALPPCFFAALALGSLTLILPAGEPALRRSVNGVTIQVTGMQPHIFLGQTWSLHVSVNASERLPAIETKELDALCAALADENYDRRELAQERLSAESTSVWGAMWLSEMQKAAAANQDLEAAETLKRLVGEARDRGLSAEAGIQVLNGSGVQVQYLQRNNWVNVANPLQADLSEENPGVMNTLAAGGEVKFESEVFTLVPPGRYRLRGYLRNWSGRKSLETDWHEFEVRKPQESILAGDLPLPDGWYAQPCDCDHLQRPPGWSVESEVAMRKLLKEPMPDETATPSSVLAVKLINMNDWYPETGRAEEALLIRMPPEYDGVPINETDRWEFVGVTREGRWFGACDSESRKTLLAKLRKKMRAEGLSEARAVHPLDAQLLSKLKNRKEQEELLEWLFQEPDDDQELAVLLAHPMINSTLIEERSWLFPSLEKSLASQDRTQIEFARELMVKVYKDKCIPLVRKMMLSSDDAAMSNTLDILTEIGLDMQKSPQANWRAMEAVKTDLVELLLQHDREVRVQNLVEAIGSLGPVGKDLMPMLATLAANDNDTYDANVSQAAGRAIWKMLGADPDWNEEGTPSPDVRKAAMRWWDEIGSRKNQTSHPKEHEIMANLKLPPK